MNASKFRLAIILMLAGCAMGAANLFSASGSSGFQVCDTKWGLQSGSHGPWVPLEGQAKASLPAAQQAVATSCSIGATLPDLRDRAMVGVSGTKPMLSVAGADTVTLAQNQLPNVNLSLTNITIVYGGTINGDNSTSGVSGIPAMENATTATTGWPLGAPTTLPSLNGGVTQQPVNIMPKSTALRAFVNLGNP
jgi:hypothetical protein